MALSEALARNGYLEKIDVGVRVYVRATPNASKDEIIGEWRGEETPLGPDVRLAVKVAAPPDKGKANAAIVKLLAKHFGVAKSAVTIVSGETGRLKVVEMRSECISFSEEYGQDAS